MDAIPPTLPQTATSPARQVWVDHLRTFMIVLVVNMHACCTYSHVGGWYVTEGKDPGLLAKIPFYFWQGHLQAFFMGLLFFLAGHFAERSLTKKGSAAFLWERFQRLALPSLLYMFVVHPFIVIGLNPYGIPSEKRLGWLTNFYASGEVFTRSGPLWFALALFFFCVALVSWRLFRTGRTQVKDAPSLGTLLTTAALMIVCTFLFRLWQPIGTNIANFQLCFFAQYIIAFAAGVLSWRQGWFESLARSRRAGVLGWCGLLGGPILLFSMFAVNPPVGDKPDFLGGPNISAFLSAFWEQLTGLCLALGCLALFARHFNRDTKVARWLSEHSFGVYFIHAPILIALSMAFADIQAAPWIKILLLTATGLIASYLAAAILKKIPGLSRIL